MNVIQSVIQKSAGQQIYQSEFDASVNWVDHASTGYFESRYVRREGRYFVIYLSSQSGCAQACRMCHLTATGQTDFVNAGLAEFEQQVHNVMSWYESQPEQAKVVHFNFMARGEPLSNNYIVDHAEELLAMLSREARARDLLPKYLVSSILPRGFEDRELIDTFPTLLPEIYYSLYSIDSEFRRKWLPKAMPVESALKKLANWQRHTSKIPKIHFAFIEGENDSEKSVKDLCKVISDLGLRVNFNIVRYNPPESKRPSAEPCEIVIKRNLEIIQQAFPDSRIKLHPRVGLDVHASCGMFVNPGSDS